MSLGDLSEEAHRLVEAWRRAGLAEVHDQRARLTPEGWLLLDRLAVELDAATALSAASGAR
jgi:coproporphyrinogen III oxidase-like Fe-S oxidoreductase